MIKSPEESNKKFREENAYFFFFMNPKSGSKLGGKLLDKVPHHFCLEKNKENEIFWFDKSKGIAKKSKVKINKKDKHDLIYSKFKKIELILVNLFDNEKSQKQFKSLAELSNKQEKKYEKEEEINLYAFACGGDGTTCWIVDELISQKANFHKIVISLIPFGTGNDFSFSMGFKRKNNC